MKICVSLGTISDVVGVQSEPPLHTGVQGVLGGEGKSAYKTNDPVHMCTKSPTKQMILLFLQGKSL
jgi:hypothetical protein